MRDRDAVTAKDGAKEGPVSRRELDSLRVRRGNTAPVLEYGRGQPTQPKQRKLDLLRAERERYVESRLKDVDGHAETGFVFASLEGRAKVDFERSR
jgi:hypothetical protein